MTISYFVYFEDLAHPGLRLSDRDRHGILEVLRHTPGLLLGHLFTPATAGGPFINDGPPPRLALQLHFTDLQDLEAVISPQGHLQHLAALDAWPSLAGTTASQQAMATRPFPVREPKPQTQPDELCCSYLVHYPGHAEDFNAWLRHYLDHHPQLMSLFPGIRAIEIFTRLDWVDSMPWHRVHHMQRNKLVFDSSEALTAALESPAIHEMRADYHRFPPFVGGNIHYPMYTYTIAHS
jgi:uncharacterized protein (TIGR02118 family)